MLTLPQIVSQIREQKPGVVPECFDFVQEVPAIFVLEAALWRESARRDDGAVWWSGVPEPQWNAMAPGQAMGDDTQSFGSDPLALIRALCHAIGVRLEDG